MRVGFHTPLPPERSGIADYSFELLEELRHHLEIVAIVRDDLAGTVRAPEGVEVAGFSSVGPADVDADVYQMGNNPKYHRFMFQRALDRPGLLVLHDPSLADFHAEMCRSADSGVFRHEIAYDNPSLVPAEPLPTVDAGPGQRDLDRLEALVARRIVEASTRTLVHSSAIASTLRARYPGADVATIQLPAPVLDEPPAGAGRRRQGEITFGVFGGINYYKRIDAIVEAFRILHPRFPAARLVIAGRPDDWVMTARLRQLVASGELGDRLELRTELSLAELEAAMGACDVAVSLRWPTAGEMSATLMRAFGAGRPAVVTDVRQFHELDERFCWRVPVGSEEVARLVEVLGAAAGDPERCAEAGRLARRFVESEATYRVVAEAYVEHVEHSARLRDAKAAALAPAGLDANAVLGVSLLDAHPPGSDGADVVAAISAGLALAGVDVVEAPDRLPRDGDVERLAPVRVVQAERTLKAQRKAVTRGRRFPAGSEPPRAARRPPAAAQLRGRARASEVAVGDLHDIVLCHADTRSAALLGTALRAHHRRGRRTVAALCPDLLPLARSLDRALLHADEIWVPSRFAAGLLAGRPLGPVVVVPVPIAPFAPGEASATGPCGPGAPLRVLAVADTAEGIARSNPLGAVAAFEAAFGPCPSAARLEVVVRRLGERHEARSRLAAALAPVGGELVEEDDGAAIRARVAACDVFVSLHRTQSLGLWSLTAMAAGKAVVATAYGAVADDASPSSACLVGYEAVECSEGDFYLDGPGEWGVEVGQRWASADVDQAGGWLRRLAAQPGLRRRLGEAARRAVASAHDEAVVAAVMRDRLERVAHRSRSDERRRKRREARLALASAWAYPPSVEDVVDRT